MKLTKICIKRPVFSCVISLVLIVIGILGYRNLSERYFPQFEAPVIRVVTSYNGASASLMETSVTTILEDAISGVQGIETIESQSMQGSSIIKIHLNANVNQYNAASQIRNKVSEAKPLLPDAANAPVVRSGWGDNGELMDIAVVDPQKTPNAIRDYLDRYITDQLEDIEGVANVAIYGADQYAMRIYLNPNKMRNYNVTADDVVDAIGNNNVELPAGEIKALNMDFPVNAKTGLTTAQQFNDIPIKKMGNSVIYLKDIGRAKLGNNSDTTTVAKFNGKTAVWLQINPTTDGNPITTAHLIKKQLAAIEDQLPQSMSIHIVFNEADFMKASIHEVYISIAIAILCVTLVIFLFLGSLRSSLIPVITIPVCLISSFFIVYLLGFSINVITLIALVLAIGLVVDDAIVMLENIYRYIEAGMSSMQAALKGSREIAFAVIAMTLTLAAVYAPIGFVHSHAAIIYRSFAFTLAAAVIISGFIALTLTPMMCARLIKPHTPKSHGYSVWLDQFFARLANKYQHFLQFALKKRIAFLIAAIVIGASGVGLFKSVPKQFMPNDDMGIAMAIITPPSGASNHLIGRMISQATTIIKANPNVANTLSVSSNQGQAFNAVFIDLKPFNERQASAQQISASLNQKFKTVPGLNVQAFAVGFGSSNKAQLQFSVMSSGSYRQLYTLSEKIKATFAHYKGITPIISNLNFDTPEYNFTVNRALAAKLDVNIKTIDEMIAALIGGEKVSTYHAGGKSYNVYIQAKPHFIATPSLISQYYVTNQSGDKIPLNTLITFKRITSQQVLSHYNRLRAVTLAAQLSPGYTLGQAVDYINKTLPNMLPANASYAFMGKAKKLMEASSSMNIIFMLAFVFIYLVLSAQFESFLDPIIILFVVPLSVVSALAALKLFGGSRNIYTDIGLVTLIGLVAKHGILITQFTNELRAKGIEKSKALIEAASLRLRPILMTTAAMVFGAIPLILATGASSHARIQIGIVIIFGLLFGTFFSLCLVPVMYSLLKRGQ